MPPGRALVASNADLARRLPGAAEISDGGQRDVGAICPSFAVEPMTRRPQATDADGARLPASDPAVATGGAEEADPRPRHRSGLAPWRLARVAAFIAENLADPLGLADMAGAAGLSRMHFAARFRATTGSSPHAYLVSVRIERAQALLSGSRMPLAEIARTVGFRTHSHFSTTFRRQAGVTPIQWRRLHSRSTAGHAEPRNASTPSPGDANKPAPKRGPNSAFFDP
jgi:AraC-like DNA-binding protein